MNTLTFIGVAVALAMDAFAVSISSGAYIKNVTFRQFFRLSWHFGLFQAMMPVIGWFSGLFLRGLIENYAHWAAFALLAFVATSMLREAFGKEEKVNKKDPTKGWRLVLLSVATSIDALAVGLSLSVINVSVWFPAAIIGLVAAVFTVAGMWLGSRVGNLLWIRRYSDVIGALVLFGIGINILHDHGVFAF